MWAGEESSDVLDAAVEAGITAFDTARVYGKSEEALGKWLYSRGRSGVFVITKGCHPLEDWVPRVGGKYIEEDLFQ